MLIDLGYLIQQYNLKIKGILHVGANECEELSIYESNGIPRSSIIWLEGNRHTVDRTRNRVPNVYHVLVSDVEEEVDFIITNNLHSSSILELDEHKKEHPWVFEVAREKQKTKRIDTFLCENDIPISFNFLNLDIQGAELKALQSMERHLNQIDYIYTEVNIKHLYKDCPLLSDIDSYLKGFGFVRLDTRMTQNGWGDAFYYKM